MGEYSRASRKAQKKEAKAKRGSSGGRTTGQDMGATPENKSRRSPEPSALTANRQAKNIRAKCLECGAKKKVTVHVSAHDRYFFFDVPMRAIWPNISAEDARVLEAHKAAFGMPGSFGRNEYTCEDCVERLDRMWSEEQGE